MESRAKIFGHSMHQLMVVFPLGLLMMSLVFDGIGLFTKFGEWHRAAFYMIGAGVVTGIAAALPGIWDWFHIPSGTRAKAIGLWHGTGNIAVLALFAIGWLIREGQNAPTNPGAIPLVLSFIAVGLGGVTAWLGGELVDRLGVGIDKGANLNATKLFVRSACKRHAQPINRPISQRGRGKRLRTAVLSWRRLSLKIGPTSTSNYIGGRGRSRWAGSGQALFFAA